MSQRVHLAYSVALAAVVVIAIAWGIRLVGSPTAARIQRFDHQRLQDLQTIFREIQSLCRDPDVKQELKRPLPATLEELADLARSERINLFDPETNEPYQYSVRGSTQYELCATFATARDADADVFWNHRSGRQCFTVDALDPP